MNDYVGWIIDLLYEIVDFDFTKIPKDEYKEKNQMRWVLEILGGTALDAKHEALLVQITLFITTYGFGRLNNKLCANFYVPSILFLVVEIIGFVWFLFTVCCGCCCGKKSDNTTSTVNVNIQSSSLL